MFKKRKSASHIKFNFHIPLSSFSKLTIGLFLIGFFFGCLGSHFFEEYLYATVVDLFRNTINQIPWLDIDRNEVFLYSLKDHITYFLLLVFFSLTNVWRIYYFGSTIYTGFSQGLLFSFCTMTYGLGGILQYFCFLLPQSILLVPVFLFALSRLELLHKNWFAPENRDIEHSPSFLPAPKKRQLLLCQLPFFFVCTVLLVCCALLEGYLNVPIIKSYNAGL